MCPLSWRLLLVLLLRFVAFQIFVMNKIVLTFSQFISAVSTILLDYNTKGLTWKFTREPHGKMVYIVELLQAFYSAAGKFCFSRGSVGMGWFGGIQGAASNFKPREEPAHHIGTCEPRVLLTVGTRAWQILYDVVHWLGFCQDWKPECWSHIWHSILHWLWYVLFVCRCFKNCHYVWWLVCLFTCFLFQSTDKQYK